MKVDAQTLEIAALCFATAAHAGQVAIVVQNSREMAA